MNTALTTTQPPELMPRQADSDSQMIALWRHGKKAHTHSAYAADVQRLLAATQKPLAEMTLGVTLLSLVLTALDWDVAFAGVILNIAILALLWLGPRVASGSALWTK